MSHRITIEEGRKKTAHLLEVQKKIKDGTYKSHRFELRRKKREDHEKAWFDYIKRRGGIKEKKKPEEETEEEKKHESS